MLTASYFLPTKIHPDQNVCRKKKTKKKNFFNQLYKKKRKFKAELFYTHYFV